MVLASSMGTYSIRAQSKNDFQDQIENLKWKNLDSAAVILRYKYNEANKLNDQQTSARLALEISKLYNKERKSDSIIKWCTIASEIYDQLDDDRGKATVQYQQAFWHYSTSNHEKALDLALKGLRQMEALKDVQGIAEGHLLCAMIFHTTDKLKESAVAGMLAGEKFERTKDYPNAALAWSFAGHAYRALKDFENTSHCFNKTLEVAKKSKNPIVLGMTFRDLAFFHNSNKKYDSAASYFRKARKEIPQHMERQVMMTENGMMRNFLYSGKYQECIDVGMQVLNSAKKRKELGYLAKVPGHIAIAYEHLGRYDSAYKYMKMKSLFSDSLFTDTQEKTLQEMQVKYETEKKEQLLADQKKNFLVVLGFGLLMVILIGVLLIFYSKRKKHNKKLVRLNRELDKKNNQNELLLKEIHHRVKNNLEMVKSLISLQSAHLEDSKTRDAMLASQNRVQSMGIIHQKLYQGDNLGSIEMKDYFINLGEGILDSFNAEERIKIECKMDELELDIDTAIPLGLIVNELLTNAIKYAFPNKKDGMVWINLKKERDTLLLNVTDSGIGKNTSQSTGTGFGSQLVQLLTIQLNGKMKEEVEDGTRISFTFELDTAA